MARTGRKPKGIRTAFTARIPSRHLDEYDAQARMHGLDRSDYVALVLARAHGLEDPEYLRRDPAQQELFPKPVDISDFSVQAAAAS